MLSNWFNWCWLGIVLYLMLDFALKLLTLNFVALKSD